MKIIHVITSLNDGGAEAVLFNLCKYDKKNKHQVVSLTGYGKYGSMLKEIGINTVKLNMMSNRLSLIPFFKLIKFLHNKKPDIVQTWLYHGDLVGGLAARIAGIKSIVWGIHHTTLDSYKSKKITIWISKLLSKLSWWIPKKIISCSRRGIDTHKKLGYDFRKMCFIPNGYDLDSFRFKEYQQDKLKINLNLDTSIPLIGTVGRFNSQKDHLNLLDALVILAKDKILFNYVLVGTGLDQSNKQIVEWIRKRGLSTYVKLLGQRNDIPKIMNGLDLHVLPSAFGEAFPNVVNEAMACGTPCVVTNVGDASFIVGDTGWVVRPKSPKALAKAIKIALQELRGGTAKNAYSLKVRRRIKENFSVIKMVKGYTELWNTLGKIKQNDNG